MSALARLPDDDDEVRQALIIARDLAACGVPIFVAKPALKGGEWDPEGGSGGCGYRLPRGWQNTRPSVATVDAWRPGEALCAVMGHALDLLDVDPRNGGDQARPGLLAAGIWPSVYAVADTPSDGTHEFIAPLGLNSLDGFLSGLDYKGGAADGRGRGFAFIAPTRKRSKITGDIVSYRWRVPPDLAALVEDDDSGDGLRRLIIDRRSGRGRALGVEPQPDGLIPIGTRDVTLTRYAWGLRQQGLDRAEADRLMEQRWHQVEQPPGDKYTLHDALAKVDSAFRKPLESDGRPSEDGTDDSAHTHHRTDLGNAHRLVGLFEDKVRWNPQHGWLAWDGKRWVPDAEHVVDLKVQQVAEQIRREADALEQMGVSDKEVNAHRSWAKQTEAERLIRAAKNLARPHVFTPWGDFDADPDVINVGNGILDLTTFALLPHEPDRLLTHFTPVPYDPSATAPFFEECLARAMPEPEMRSLPPATLRLRPDRSRR